MSEILFRFQDTQEGATGSDASATIRDGLFNIGDIFSAPQVSKCLHKLVPPTALRTTPKDLYTEMREIAKQRFGFELPNDMKRLLCLQSINNKTSLLRDLCKSLGVKLEYNPKHEFLLGNKTKQIVAYYNDQAAKQREQANAGKQNKKKGAQQV